MPDSSSAYGSDSHSSGAHAPRSSAATDPARGDDGSTNAPSDLPKKSWATVLKRAVGQIKKDELTDRAAALTYYGVQAIFPGLLVLVSIVGLLGHSTTQTLIDNLGQIAPGSVKSTIETIITNAQKQKSTAGIAGIVGLVLALWSASGYVSAFMRSANAIYGIGEGRPIWKTAPVRLSITLFTVVGLVAGLVIVVATGSVATQVGKALGVGSTAVTVWEIAKWPVLLLIFMVILAVLYSAAPNVKHGGFKWFSPGAVVAVVIWLIASALFAFYVANFGSYNKTYGALASVIIFLVWLWISNLAILLGAEFNAELEHERALHEGISPEAELFAEPKDTRKLDDDDTHDAKTTAAVRDAARKETQVRTNGARDQKSTKS